MVNWTLAQKNFVWELLDQGKSAAEIGNMMGVSKGTVMGRIHRDPNLRDKMKAAFAARPVRLPSTRIMIDKDKKTKKQDVPPPPPPPPVRSWVPETFPELRKDRVPPITDCMALIDVRANCRWPLHDDDRVIGGIICCGAAIPPDAVYCEFHRNLGRTLPYKIYRKTKELT